MVTLLLTIFIFERTLCQQFHYLPIEPSSECRGKSTIEEISLELEWDISNIYDSNGWELPDSAISPQTKYRASVCGGINTDIVSCEGERTWCLEVTNITNNECISGLSNWDSSSSIKYFAITDSLIKYAHILGIRVQVNDTDDIFNMQCPKGKSIVNYDIICHANKTIAYSIYSDINNCYYTISIHSEFGCVNYQPIQGIIVDYLIDMDQGQTCRGKTSIEQLNIAEIEWDLGALANQNGFEKPDYIFGELPNQMFRLSLCNGMKDNASKCQSERDLCLEVSTLNGTCIKPLAAWDINSLIFTYALFNSSNPDHTELKGLRISLWDDHMSNNSNECGYINKPINVNYELICMSDKNDDTILIPSVISNDTTCVYNITIMSKWSCANIIQKSNNEDFIDEFSIGTILLLIVVIIFVMYLIIGCGYNGCMHGRIGFDAMPNKIMWKQFIRYAYAGCITCKETCCFCSNVPTTYQEL